MHPSRKGTLALTTSAILAASGLAACSIDQEGSQGPDYAGVCMNSTTHNRVDDTQCQSGGHGAGWVYYPMGRSVGAVGSRLSGYDTSVPKDKTYSTGGFAKSGGTTSVDSIAEGTPIKGTGGVSKGSVARGGFGAGEGGHGG